MLYSMLAIYCFDNNLFRVQHVHVMVVETIADISKSYQGKR
jgi:hypothetical protein